MLAARAKPYDPFEAAANGMWGGIAKMIAANAAPDPSSRGFLGSLADLPVPPSAQAASYAPYSGLFLQLDPIGFQGGSLAYLRNDPPTRTDSTEPIRGPRALEQFAMTPPNATVFLVLGTNDANGTIVRLDKSIDDIVQAAERKNIKLIWLGPPCVRQSWDTRSRDLDLMLSARFAGTAVHYVSMRDSELCSGSLQEPDGVHLKPKGYVHMWEKAAAAAGYALAAVAPVASGKVAAARIPLPIPRRPLDSDITGSIAKAR
jgi:hypothetical protein